MRYILLLLIPCGLWAQMIKGRVVDADTKKPLESATVFLAQSSYKVLTDAEGNFEIALPNSNTQLVVTYVGYDAVAIAADQINNPSVIHVIQLKQQEQQIREVKVISKKQREYYLKQFTEQILGKSKNADDSRIVNIDAVMLDVSADGKAFEAYADEPLIIEISALNYRIEMLLSVFSMDWRANMTKFVGYASYSNLKSDDKVNPKKILRNRMTAYLGSSLHFFRSIYQRTFRDEGFIVRSFKKIENPEYPDDETRKALVDEFKKTRRYDSRLNAPKYIFEFSKGELSEGDFVLSDHSGKSLAFPDGLEITYIHAQEEHRFVMQAHRHAGNFQKSEITALKPVVPIHPDGSYSDIDGLIFHGYMGWKKLADTVPNDFQPVVEK